MVVAELLKAQWNRGRYRGYSEPGRRPDGVKGRKSTVLTVTRCASDTMAAAGCFFVARRTPWRKRCVLVR